MRVCAGGWDACVQGHLSRVPASSAAHVRAMVFNNKAMATREHLEREVASWVDRYAGSVLPHGNAQGMYTDAHILRLVYTGRACYIHP